MLDRCVCVHAAYRAAPWIFAVAIAAMPFAASAQSSLPAPDQALVISTETSPAQRGTAPAPKQVDLSAVPQITAKQLSVLAARRQLPRPRTFHTEQQYAAFKTQAARLRFDMPNVEPVSPPTIRAAGSVPAGAGTEAVLTPSASISFIGNTQNPCGSVPALGSVVTPADMGLAVGDTNNNGVLQVNNVCISVFSKAGVLQPGFPKPLASLANNQNPATTCFSDPRALYDWVQHRYIIAFAQLNCANFAAGGFPAPSSYWVAVTTADNPTGTYNAYNFISKLSAGANELVDFPRMGQDRQGIYVASNGFATDGMGNPLAYDGEEWLLLPKAAMYAGTSFTYNDILNPMSPVGAFLDSSQPANVFSKMDNPRAEFFVTSFNTQNASAFPCLTTIGCNGLLVWAVSNPLDTAGPGPEVSVVRVNTTFNYALPPSATQPGSTSAGPFIDTGDVRISGEVSYVAGSLYAALTTNAPGGVAGFIQYKIQPVLNDGNARCTGNFANACADVVGATISDEAAFFYNNGQSAYYPTPQPDPEGNVTTVFNASGPTLGGSTVYTSKRVTQKPGTFHDGGFCLHCSTTTTSANNCDPTTNICRWGDYTGVAPAGEAANSNSPEMWFAGMFTQADGTWGTQIGRNRYSTPDLP